MNELNATDKALVVNALLRLVGEDVLTQLEKRDILHEITSQLTGFNIAEIVNQTTNRRRLLLKGLATDEEYTGLPRELVFNPTDKTLKVFGETSADDTIIGAVPDIDIEALLANMDYVTLSATGLSGTNYTNGWYKKYKSGWVEQGFTGAGSTSGFNISLPLPMANTSYSLIATPNQGNSSYPHIPLINKVDATQIWLRTVQARDSGSAANIPCSVLVIGTGA